MSAAGALVERMAFDSPVETISPTGGQISSWREELAKVRANVRYLRGGEVVIAARLTGQQPAVVTVRSSARTRAIKTDWRIRNLATGEVGAIRAIVPTDDRSALEITCEFGVQP